MKSLAKAESIARDLREKILFRLAAVPALNQAEASRDADGWPVLTISNDGAVTAGAKCAIIRIKGADAVSKDVFGNDDTAFTPHIMEIATEAGVMSHSEFAQIFAECAKYGTRIQLKESANLTAASLSTAVSADLDNLEWPTKTA